MTGRTNTGGQGAGPLKKGTIVVSYPSGATCTVTSGSNTYTALSTSGSAAFLVDAGTWTVKAVQGSDSASKSVTVAAGGWVSVELSFRLFIYDGGTASSYFGTSTSINQSYFGNKSGYVGVHTSTLGTKAYAYLLKTADLSNVSQIKVSGYALVYDSRYEQKIEVAESIGGTAVASLSLNQSSGSWGSATQDATSVLDVSGLKGTKYYVSLSNTRSVADGQWAFYVSRIELV